MRNLAYRWRSKYLGMHQALPKGLKGLEIDNTGLKKIVAQLDRDALKGLVGKEG